MPKHLHFTVVPEGGVVRTFKVSFTVLVALFVGLASGLFAVAGSGLHVLKSLGLRHDLSRLKHENDRLRGHLGETEGKLVQVEHLVSESEEMEKRARLLAGLDPVDEQTRRLGIGGPFVALADPERTSDPGLDRIFEDQSHRLDELIRKAEFQQESYLETLETLSEQQMRLAHTPTISPLRGDHAISSGFGGRSDPFTGEHGVHNGIDLRAPRGTPVFATAAGTVISAGYDGDFGKCIRVKHGYGYETLYCHLSEISVGEGDDIERGAQLGQVGSSGRSTGSHLHYEVHLDGLPRDPAMFVLAPNVVVD